jgi:hypothetical protein
MIAAGAKNHQGSKVEGMIDRMPRAITMKRLSSRNDAAVGTVADLEAVGTSKCMARMYPSHPATTH